MVKAHENHEVIEGLFAGKQPTGDPLPEVARRSVPKREHGKGNKHDDNLYASSGTSQSNHPPIGVYE